MRLLALVATWTIAAQAAAAAAWPSAAPPLPEGPVTRAKVIFSPRPPPDARTREWRRCADYEKPKQSIAACTRLLRALSSDEDLAEAYNYRSMAHAKAKRYRLALSDLDEAIKRQGGQTNAHRASYLNVRAGLKRELKDFPGALADHDLAVKLDEAEPFYHVERGMTHEAAGDAAAATSDYEKALSLGLKPPDEARIKARLEALKRKA